MLGTEFWCARPATSLAHAVIALAFIVTLGQMSALAQVSPELHPDVEHFRKYAPIVWPATLERTWPILPHALAFDGIDNNGDTFIDLDDPEEVGFSLGLGQPKAWCGSSGDKTRVAADLIECVEQLKEHPRPRVLYAPPPTEALTVSNGSRRREIEVLGYWFYYAYDLGPRPHAHDSEHAFVFLNRRQGPLPTPLRNERWLSPEVAGIVGAGHDGSTANNIVVTGQLINELNGLPWRLPMHPGILVEYGKHASAPDIDLNGRFDLGVDANMLRDAAWGSRDSVAINQGQLQLRGFSAWQSFPRDLRNAIPEASFLMNHEDGSYELLRRRLRSEDVPAKELNTYELFPLHDLKQLYQLIPRGRPHVEQFLEQHKHCFWATRAPDRVRIGDAAWAVMQQWPSHADSRLSPWLNADYVNPDRVFRLYLFPTIGASAGIVSETDGPAFLRSRRLALQFSDISSRRFLIGRLLPARLFTDGSMELAVTGASGRQGWFDNAAVTIKHYRGNRLGPYVGLQFRRAQLDGAEDMSADELKAISDAAGVSLDALNARQRETAWHPGLRFGGAFTHHFTKFWFEAQAGIVLESGGLKGEVDRAFGARSNIRSQATLSLFIPLKAPRHPLSY